MIPITPNQNQNVVYLYNNQSKRNKHKKLFIKMTNKVHFTKMHGTGNDYIYVNVINHKLNDPEKLSQKWSDRHTGIGGDGLVLIDSSTIADFKMRIFNADGSEAMMCGNASRCIGKYVYEKGLTKKTSIRLETLSGIKELKLKVDQDEVKEVTVDMGVPLLVKSDIEFNIDGIKYTGTQISMGNPHLVLFVEDIDKVDLEKNGPLLECHSLFPDRINVEFAQVLSPSQIRMRVWERGSGITKACGTGACATAAAGVITGKTLSQSTVVMDGGSLFLNWQDRNKSIFMTGEAVTVFEGTIEI